MLVYLMLDGTADVDLAHRCRAAARIGYGARVCALDNDQDPDDLAPEQLAAEKRRAVGVLDAWLGWVGELQRQVEAGEPKADVALRETRRELAGELARWRDQAPADAPAMRKAVCGALGYTAGEYEAWLQAQGGAKPLPAVDLSAAEAVVDEAATQDGPAGDTSGSTPAQRYPGQPPPFDPERTDDEVPVIQNFGMEERRVKDKRTGQWEDVPVPIATSIRPLFHRVLEAGRGWPARLRSPGAKLPTLFIDEVQADRHLPAGHVRFVLGSTALAAVLKNLGTVKFLEKRDHDNTNFVTYGELCDEFGNGVGVKEYLSVEVRPHQPPIPGHYYAWRPGHGPCGTGGGGGGSSLEKGEHLVTLLGYFANCKDCYSRAVLAAFFLTPGWGGRYGKRPMGVLQADLPGSGKTTMVEVIGQVWGGTFGTDLEKDSVAKLRERLLTPDCLTKRVCLLDNVRGSINSPELERLITEKHIDGKRLYTGDASRPNVLCWFVTTNNLRMTPDLCTRAFFVELVKPEVYEGSWDREVTEFVDQYSVELVEEACAILQTVPPARNFKENDRWAAWCGEVLARALAHPGLQAWIRGDREQDVRLEEVLAHTRHLRGQADEAQHEAEIFFLGVLERVCDSRRLVYEVEGILSPGDAPTEDVWVSSEELRGWYGDIFGRKVNSKWLTPRINEHVRAGRITGMGEVEHSREGNGAKVYLKAITEYLERIRATADEKRQSNVQQTLIG